MWQSPHPLALRVDPDADRPKLIGSTWVRRVPEGDLWDHVRIGGVFDTGNDANGLELVVQTVEFGEPTMTADAEDFARAYRRETDDDDPAERLQARLRELEARAAG